MIKTTFNTGNFALAIEGEFDEEQKDKALVSALRYIVQRDGATKAYAALAGEKGENGKTKLPKDFERGDLEYSKEAGKAFADAFEKALEGYGTFTVSASKYEGSEVASPMKRATTLVDTFLAQGGAVEQGYRTVLGLPDGDRDALIAKANEMGLGIQPPRQKKAEGSAEGAEE